MSRGNKEFNRVVSFSHLEAFFLRDLISDFRYRSNKQSKYHRCRLAVPVPTLHTANAEKRIIIDNDAIRTRQIDCIRDDTSPRPSAFL